MLVWRLTFKTDRKPREGGLEHLLMFINYLIPVTPRRRWATLTDASAAITAHWSLSSLMRSNDDFDWPTHSFMLSFHDLRGLPYATTTFQCSLQYDLGPKKSFNFVRQVAGVKPCLNFKAFWPIFFVQILLESLGRTRFSLCKTSSGDSGKGEETPPPKKKIYVFEIVAFSSPVGGIIFGQILLMWLCVTHALRANASPNPVNPNLKLFQAF